MSAETTDAPRFETYPERTRKITPGITRRQKRKRRRPQRLAIYALLYALAAAAIYWAYIAIL